MSPFYSWLIWYRSYSISVRSLRLTKTLTHSPKVLFTFYLHPYILCTMQSVTLVHFCTCHWSSMIFFKYFLTLSRSISNMSWPKLVGRYIPPQHIRAKKFTKIQGTWNLQRKIVMARIPVLERGLFPKFPMFHHVHLEYAQQFKLLGDSRRGKF